MFKIKMNWKNLIIFALIAGIYTGAVMLIPILENTSFQDIGITYEWWVIFAVFIVNKCEKPIDAMLKCFIFFLISQPLVYIVEIIFGSLEFGFAMQYYKQMWLPATFLTLPGGFIAYYCKKHNILGASVLALGCTIQLILGVFYTITVTTNFPNHILSAIICFASVIIMSFKIQKIKKYRILTILLALFFTTIIITVIKSNGLYIVSNIF